MIAPETAPRNVTVINAYPTSLNISWLIPDVPNGIVDRYEVLVINEANIPTPYILPDTGDLIIVYFEATFLDPDQNYRIEVFMNPTQKYLNERRLNIIKNT